MELFEYEQHCRICLKARNASKNIFNHIMEGCQEPLVQILFSLFQIELHSHTAFPQFVCRKCLTEVENILLFKEDLLRNQELLFNLFRASYPNYVEKKTTDFRKICNSISSTSTNLTPLNNPGYVSLQKSCVTKHENTINNVSETDCNLPSELQDIPEARVNCKYCDASFKFNYALQDHYSKYHCLEQKPKEELTSNHDWKHLIKPLTTDENRNVSQMQLQQTDINENNSSLNNAKFSGDPDSDCKPAALDIPQASFLQNLDLITLQDAEILRTRQTLPNCTRRKFISRKFKTISGVSKTRNTRRKRTNESKKLPTNEDFTDLFARRSANFLSRYGCRNLKYTCLKQGKIFNKSESVTCNVFQRRKNVNRFVSSKVAGSSLGPRPHEKLKAVLKEKDCDISLDNSTCNKNISPSKLKLETADEVKDDSLISENAHKKAKNAIKPIVKKEFLPSPIISKQHKSLGEYRPILTNSFYRSVTTRNKNPLLDNKHLLLRNNQYSTYSNNCDSDSGTNNSLRGRKEFYNNGLKLRLFRSPSLSSRLGSEDQTEKDVWSIDDSTSLKGYDFRKRLQVQIKKSPNKFKRNKSFDKLIYNSHTLAPKVEQSKSTCRTNKNSNGPSKVSVRTRSKLGRSERMSSIDSTHDGNVTKLLIPVNVKRKRLPRKLKRNSTTSEYNDSSKGIKIEDDNTNPSRTIIQEVNGHGLKEFSTCNENSNIHKTDANEIPASENLKMKDIKQEILAEHEGSSPSRKLRSRSCENISFLKYDTQEADDIIYSDVLRKSDSTQKSRLLKNRFLNKVHDVNVNEGQEFQFTLTHANFLIDTVPEDMDYADLSEYRGRRPKSLILIENKCEKRPKTCDFLRTPRRKRQKGILSSRSSERLQRSSLGDQICDDKFKCNTDNVTTPAKTKVKTSLKTFCRSTKRKRPKLNPAKISRISAIKNKKRKEFPDKNKVTKKKNK